MTWTFGSASDIGDRDEQQDRMALLHSRDGHHHLLVVADGMGGLPDGARAAQALIDQAEERFFSNDRNKVFDLLQGICLSTHKTLRALVPEGQLVPGTTMVMLYLNQSEAYWMHVGDSRLYQFRKGKLLNQTNDHSMLQLMLDRGFPAEEGSFEFNSMQNRLYMRLGGEHEPEADFNGCKLQDGDLFVLCSDGLWQAFRADELAGLLAKQPLDQSRVEQIVRTARRRNGEGSDNVSLLVAKWQKAGLIQKLKSLCRLR